MRANPMDAYDGTDGKMTESERESFDLVAAVDRVRELKDEVIRLSKAIEEYSGLERQDLEWKRRRLDKERRGLADKIEQVAPNLHDRPRSVAMEFDVFTWDSGDRVGKRVVAVDGREAVEKAVGDSEGVYRALCVYNFDITHVDLG